MSKTKVKGNRYFEEIALDLLDACGGAIRREGVERFWKREERMSKRLSETAKIHILQIAINYQTNP
jgi:hypothetical protein